MGDAIRQAVILAAGRGTRMGDLTAHVPKPLLQVRGVALLDHVLGHLSTAGVDRFFIVTGYLHEQVEAHVRGLPYEIETCLQTTVNGTATAAQLARDFTGSAPFLLTFTDIFSSPQAFIDCARALSSGASAVLGVRDVDDPWQGAAVYTEGNRITRVIEKPPRGTSTTRWNSAGIYAFRHNVFSYLAKVRPSQRNEYELTSIFDAMLSDGLDLRISPVPDPWRDVGRPEDIEALNAGF